MQVCFFKLCPVIPLEQALTAIKDAIKKTYGKKGEEMIRMNMAAVDAATSRVFEVPLAGKTADGQPMPPPVSEKAPAFVRDFIAPILVGCGDDLPVSAMPKDGTFPTDTARWEKRNIALEIPVWEPQVCIQCCKCTMVCPHASIRAKVFDPAKANGNQPASFKSADPKNKEWAGLKFVLQVAAEDCTGCGLCTQVCPAKSKSEAKLKAINMRPQLPLLEAERTNWDYFLSLPEFDRARLKITTIREQQLQRPLFEFSGSCAGCGETPYVKLLSQLFGDRLLIANATGCSSIYGGNLPTTPYAKDLAGRGPTWNNSLFEDNAEFGLGIRLALDQQIVQAGELLRRLSSSLSDQLVTALLGAEQKDEAGIAAQRERVAELKRKLAGVEGADAKSLLAIADVLVRKSVWILGGDGWAYDIGYGGLDHVFSVGRDVNILVLDTEVYSNTGGQMSKSTPRGAVAKFAAAGKPARKKDLGLMAMNYGNVYVASVAMGAKDDHALRSFVEAEAYRGPSLILAYSHCIAHGIDMGHGLQNQKMAVDSGHWLLYRYDPTKAGSGENPLKVDSAPPKTPLEEFMMMENRFKVLTRAKPEVAKRLFQDAQMDAQYRRKLYEHLSKQEG
jgi:pyruvate-ferredoxin/flavodoxin oxidoreductase